MKRLEQAQISDLSVATLYHSGQILSLAGVEPRLFYQSEGALWDFRMATWHHADLTIEPPLFYRELKARLSESGIRLRGWTIVNHDAKGAPLVENAFGQRIPHAACPIQGRQRFGKIMDDLAQMGTFDGVDLESVGFTKAFHGAHHEITGVHITPLLQFLLSWCFCSACQSALSEGIAWETLRQETKTDIARLLNHDTAPQNPMGELANFFATNPHWAPLIKRRGHWLQELIDESSRKFPAWSIAPILVPYDYRAQLSWLEGLIADVTQRGDLIMLGYSHPAVMREDLNWLVLDKGWDMSRVIIGQSLVGDAVPSWEEAKARVQTALDYGIRRFSFYNFGILNSARWQWLEHLSSIIRHEH